MSGITDLNTLLSSLKPTLLSGEFVFLTFPDAVYGDRSQLQPIASFVEPEGLTLVVRREHADGHGQNYEFVFRMISLQVHSSLEAVGLTAAISGALADQGISANVVAAFYHDHLFVPAESANQAMETLESLANPTDPRE